MAPDCFMVMIVEFLVDWIKHAFITRFNEVPAEVYKNYTIFLAYDLAQTKQKHVSLTTNHNILIHGITYTYLVFDIRLIVFKQTGSGTDYKPDASLVRCTLI